MLMVVCEYILPKNGKEKKVKIEKTRRDDGYLPKST